VVDKKMTPPLNGKGKHLINLDNNDQTFGEGDTSMINFMLKMNLEMKEEFKQY
jgi:hypothetical protein